MIRTRSISIDDPDDGGKFHLQEVDDFEFVNPIEQLSSIFIGASVWLDEKILAAHGYSMPTTRMDEFLFKKAVGKWASEYKKITCIKLPINLFRLMEANSKKEQIKSLKGLSLTSDELVAFLFMAHEKYGFKYSQYRAQHYHKGFDETRLPTIIHVGDNGVLKTIGKTDLTKGQQRQAVEHRKVTVSKFLDNGSDWHCFFLTFRSMGGKENYKEGQPHLHYISSKWGIERDEVRNQLTSKDYSLPSLPHIDFDRHRNLKDESTKRNND